MVWKCGSLRVSRRTSERVVRVLGWVTQSRLAGQRVNRFHVGTRWCIARALANGACAALQANGRSADVDARTGIASLWFEIAAMVAPWRKLCGKVSVSDVSFKAS